MLDPAPGVPALSPDEGDRGAGPAFAGCAKGGEGKLVVLDADDVLIIKTKASRLPGPRWVLSDGRGSMLCAPIPHSLRSYSLIRTNDAIDGMTLEQLRAGIL